jgi:GNAT superfamily N-acetyltransferase
MSAVPIRRAVDGEAPALGLVIARAFAALPVTHWLVPDDPADRVAALGGQFGMLVAHAMEHGDVYVAGDGQAVAVWFPPGPMPDVPDYEERLIAACGPHTPRFVELDELMHKAHPIAPDHAYLAFLAVEPEHQGHGIGSALLDAHHARLDADGIPVYLDASGRDSRRLYQRYGYGDHAEPYGPAGLLEFHPMWRDPR